MVSVVVDCFSAKSQEHEVGKHHNVDPNPWQRFIHIHIHTTG